MRIAVAVLALLAAACSTTECKHCGTPERTATVFFDTNGDGLPDTRGGIIALPVFGVAAIQDTDHDGLPDVRLPTFEAPNGQTAFFDTDGDGQPDTAADGFGFTSFGRATFADTDSDGLPDTRIVEVGRDEQIPVEDGLEQRLRELEQAIAEIRRELRSR